MYCFKCKTKQNLDHKVVFRAVCETCGSDLHVCKNCKYYYPTKPNNCLIPNTDPISDAEKFNFCEDFFPSNYCLEEKKTSKEDVAKRLFKD